MSINRASVNLGIGSKGQFNDQNNGSSDAQLKIENERLKTTLMILN